MTAMSVLNGAETHLGQQGCDEQRRCPWALGSKCSRNCTWLLELVRTHDRKQDVVMVRREQYERLGRHLSALGYPLIEMSFADVAAVIGGQLPPSAHDHPAWWASDPDHTQSVWLDVGYAASPNLTAQRVTFTRIKA
jgi:hypothetical protein